VVNHMGAAWGAPIAEVEQPAPDDPYLASKVTFWESNGQIARRVRIEPS
jgi:hypothetical protein